MNPTLQVGMRAPTTLQITVTPSDPSLDLTTVTAVTFTMRRSNKTIVTLAANILSASKSQLVAGYMFNSNGQDLNVSGPYQFDPQLTVPGGFINCESVPMMVQPAFGFGGPYS